MIRLPVKLAGTACLGAKEYVDCFEIARGLAFLPLAKVRLHVKARGVAIRGHSICALVRPGTTDVAVSTPPIEASSITMILLNRPRLSWMLGHILVFLPLILQAGILRLKLSRSSLTALISICRERSCSSSRIVVDQWIS